MTVFRTALWLGAKNKYKRIFVIATETSVWKDIQFGDRFWYKQLTINGVVKLSPIPQENWPSRKFYNTSSQVKSACIPVREYPPRTKSTTAIPTDVETHDADDSRVVVPVPKKIILKSKIEKRGGGSKRSKQKEQKVPSRRDPLAFQEVLALDAEDMDPNEAFEHLAGVKAALKQKVFSQHVVNTYLFL